MIKASKYERNDKKYQPLILTWNGTTLGSSSEKLHFEYRSRFVLFWYEYLCVAIVGNSHEVKKFFCISEK